MNTGPQLPQDKHHLQRPRRGVVDQRHGAPPGIQRQARVRCRRDDLLAQRRDAIQPRGGGQILAGEAGDLVPVELGRTDRAANRDARFPHPMDEIGFEYREDRMHRDAGGLAQYTGAACHISRERVLVSGLDAFGEGVRVQHEHRDRLFDG